MFESLFKHFIGKITVVFFFERAIILLFYYVNTKGVEINDENNKDQSKTLQDWSL